MLFSTVRISLSSLKEPETATVMLRSAVACSIALRPPMPNGVER